MSERSRAVEVGGGRRRAGKANSTAASTATPPPTCTAFHRLAPPSTDLMPIAHSPDPVTRIVAHQQRSIRQHQQAHWPAPARAVWQLPTGDEVFTSRWPPVGDMHSHHLRPRRCRAVPGAMVRHERVALIVAREPRARIEREAEWRRVRLHRERRGLDAGTVETTVLGVWLPREIALRPAVPPAVLEDIHVLRRKVVTEVVTIVVVRPQLAGRGIEGQAYGVAEPRCEGVRVRTVGVVASHRC